MTLKFLAAAAFLFSLPLQAAHAEGPWRVGQSYVVRSAAPATADERGEVLEAMEVAASRLCRDQRTRGRREACKTAALETALNRAPAHLRAAVELARAERDSVRMVAR